MAKPFNGHPMKWLVQLASDPHRHSTAIRVALGIADHVNRKTGEAWPSKYALAKEIGVAVRSVERHLTELEQDGWIEKVRRGNGKSNLYRLTVTDPDPPSTADQNSYPDPPPTADQDSLPDPPSSADQTGVSDPPSSAFRSATQRIPDPPHMADAIEEPIKEPISEPIEGAAPHAPAPPDGSVLRTPATETALRAAGAASGGPSEADPEIWEIVAIAEDLAVENPNLARADFKPASVNLTPEDAVCCLQRWPAAGFYRDRAKVLRKLVQACRDDDDDKRVRAMRASGILLAQADLVTHAAELARAAGFGSMRRKPNLSDEVPF